MSLSFGTDLTGKVAVVTGAGGVLCGMFAATLAEAGAKVAVLDLNEEAAKKVADGIVAAGHVAKAYKTNVLEKPSLEETHEKVLADLGPCDILVNGADITAMAIEGAPQVKMAQAERCAELNITIPDDYEVVSAEDAEADAAAAE